MPFAKLAEDCAPPAAKHQQLGGIYFVAKTQRLRKTAPQRCAGPENNCLNHIAAKQAFMAVQMLVNELDNPYLEDQLDCIANTLNNDERYRPSQFAAMLAALAEPGPEVEDIDEQDE